MARAKIVCTIGPATRSPKRLRDLIRAGMDVARLNFSFGEHEAHLKAFRDIRRIAREENRAVAIMQDLQGPKVRLRLAEPTLTLGAGQTLTLTDAEEPPSPREAAVSTPEMVRLLKPRQRIILADGAVELVVEETDTGRARCTAVRPGTLRDGMGVTVPEAAMDLPGLTPKDRADLAVGLELGADLVALSFVRTGQDLRALKALMEEQGRQLPIVAKIELAQALDHLDDILEEAWGVMVARGDLGIQLPPEEVPFYQKQIIARCNHAGVTVITATQMLESMVRESRPTRAEASDVANAVLDGTDAVMLSGETAIGRFPVEAVNTMRRIIEVADLHCPYEEWLNRWPLSQEIDQTAAVAQAAVRLAEGVGARAIICTTTSGHTARMVARFRPRVRILAVTPRQETYRRLALVWGVRPVLAPEFEDTDTMLARSIDLARQCGYVEPGDGVVVTAGVPVGVPGTTNLIKLATV